MSKERVLLGGVDITWFRSCEVFAEDARVSFTLIEPFGVDE